MKFTLRGASSAALLIGLAGALPAWAQDTITAGPQPPAEESDDGARVVVTGSFIQGTPEDAALPVEVFSQEELEEQGAPTALEFAKSLTISGPTTGEAYYFSGAQLTGSVNYNLRGLGSDKTLVLLNGRRMSQNTANIPSAALARTEVLKDGAAVIYGADATGGVVNFITRDDFVGLEVSGQYKYIDGSDGDYGLSILGGVGDGDVNFLWSAEYEHRSRLESEERDWAAGEYGVNPSPWSPLTNVASWIPLGARPATFSRDAYNAGLALNRPYAGEFGGPVSGLALDFTQSSCEAVGGVFNPNGVATGVASCSYNYASYYNLVEENDIYRGFAQLNAAVNENMDFHFDVSYGQVKSPQVFGSPAQPVIRGPAVSTGATYQFYVPDTNPYFAEFAQRSGLAARTTTVAPGVTVPTISLVDGVAALTYRAFAHGGNPFLGEGNGFGVPSKIDNQIWRVSSGINGNLGDWAGPLSDVGYDFAVTYNQSISYADSPDMIGYRLQDALAGFGGPNCTLTDQNPNQFGIQNTSVGTSAAERAAFGCYYWNPFASSFANQPELGLNNPVYVAGSENRADVARWLFDDRATETINSSLTADVVFNGMSGIQLPGGEIGWALGGQTRQLEFREIVNSPLYNGSQPCDQPNNQTIGIIPPGGGPSPTGPSQTINATPRNTADPLFAGCTPDSPGPFVFFGTNVPDYADQQQYSLFGELQIPLLDNLNFQAAVRREEFSGGLGSTVYKVSGKWDVWGPLSLRGSYGTNYQAPPAGLIPGELTNGVLSYTRAAGSWLGSQVLTRNDVVPETATAWNMGVIWQSEGFAPDHDLSIIVDYFDIETEDELGVLASNEQIANGVFRFRADGTAFANQDGTFVSGVTTGVNNGTALADCSHPLISRVQFNGGACVQGVTNALALNSIRTDFGNGPGQHIAGFDVNVTYSLPLGPGDLTANVTATKVEVDENSATILDGFQIAPPDDRLGFFNFATVGNSSPELRLNASLNYALDQHNFRLGAQYVSSVTDERGPVTPGGRLPGTLTPYSLTDYGVESGDWLSFDFTYLFRVTEDLRLTATVANLTDEDPPESRQELGYDPRMGSPLGRTFELGIKKTF